MNTQEQTEQTACWLDSVDQRGPSASVADLRALLRAAPESTRETHEYHYIFGLIVGRETAVDLPRRSVFAALSELEAVQRQRPSPSRWSVMREGVIDGISLELGLI